jgi:MFS family permease
MQSLLPTLSPHDLLRDTNYRRLWTSVLMSSLGSQVTLLALPLSAAVLLKATPTQMGYLTSMELLPFLLLSLPVGVLLDRVRKLPVYRWGEVVAAVVLASVPLVWGLGYLSMSYLYGVAFATGCVFVTAGTASQIVLTQVVARERLVEAHAKNALASSGADVVGPGLAGVLIQLVGAPLALLADALMLATSVLLLRGLKVSEDPVSTAPTYFWRDLHAGLHFVAHQRLLLTIALMVGLWQVALQCAMVTQILFATQLLGLSEQEIGLCFVGLGLGTVLASVLGHRISTRIGPGPCLILGLAASGTGWLQLAVVPAGRWGVASFVLMLWCFGFGAVLMFINFLALRQAVTPTPMLGRMTSTVRWLMLLGAAPGALLGGYLGEHWGLRYAMGLGGAGALLVALWAWCYSGLRQVRELPALGSH